MSDEPRLAGAAARAASEVREATRHDGLFWRRLAYAGAVHGPWWWRRYSPKWFGALAWALVGDRRRACAKHWREIGLVDSEPAAQLGALRTYLAFAESLTDGLEIAGRGLGAYSVTSPTPSPMKQAIALGRGVIVVTAHTGSWEVMGNMLGANHDVGVTMVMAPEENETARAFADGVRQRNPRVEIAYVGRDPTDALALVAALRAKRVVALQLDRTPPGMATMGAPFFGRERRFPVGPFRLAQATGAPLVAAFTRRVGFRRYVVDMPVGVLEVPRGRRDDSRLAPHVAAIARGFEQFVRRNPEQWYHFEQS
ncbi:MAG: lysophospholipid acyltransferase family protein [Deltaproteobacteria bacterium]|nr:lysophospholipid acyltransferase family protein [Deltaproteobacteria bacterium]